MKTIHGVQVAMLLAILVALSASTGCSAAPLGLAANLAGRAINDADVQNQAKQLQDVSVAQADQILGPPLEVYRATDSAREWRVYPVKNDVLKTYRYVLETTGGSVSSVSKSERYSDMAVDAATYASFSDRCMGKSPQACQDAVGTPPALSARNVQPGQLVQLYDARLVQGVQRPYYAVLHFGPDNLCADIKVVLVAASTTSNPVAR